MSTLGITVTNSSLAPVSGLEVAIYERGRMLTSMRTNSSGFAEFTLPNGTYQLVTRLLPNYIEESETITLLGNASLTRTRDTAGLPNPVSPAQVILFGEVHSLTDRRLYFKVQEVRASQWNRSTGGGGSSKSAFTSVTWGDHRRAEVVDGRWSIAVFAGSMVRIECVDLGISMEAIIPVGRTTVHVNDLVPRQGVQGHLSTGDSPDTGGSDGA